ncbi:MAG: response regulator transcription factor, partial [Lachnospiraceae bacterium]|nr:response regulator transcription factor [Lachnospiraceae bacterium]
KQGADLVLMDVLIPGGMSGLEAARQIKQISPSTRIIIVTSMPELSYINQAKDIGVESFWYKEVQEQPILEIMDRTMEGESVYPSSPPLVMLGEAASTDFTEREVDILRELVGGSSNREISEKLGISEKTVKMHVTNLLQKTGYHSRLELAVRARHFGVAIKS